MKTLHLIPTFGPGGAERQLPLLASALDAQGVEVHVAYCTGGPNLSYLQDSSVHTHVIPSTGNHDPLLAWRIARLLRRLRPDVVQTWLLQMDVLGGLAALLNRVPLIVSERSSAAAYPSGWKTRMRREIGRRAACIVANSHGGIDYWRPYFPAERLHLVRNALPARIETHVAPKDLDAFGAQGRTIVMFAGRFSYEKNIPGLVEALILVARQREDVVAMMFGEGPERAEAAQRIAAAGLSERILLKGYSSELPAWMARSAVCVSVSHFEGHPNVVMEAAAAGCPQVLSDVPAHRELFDDASAAIVPADSPGRIAEAVLDVLQNPTPARERADRARTIVAQCDLQATARAYRQIYEQAAASARRHTP